MSKLLKRINNVNDAQTNSGWGEKGKIDRGTLHICASFNIEVKNKLRNDFYQIWQKNLSRNEEMYKIFHKNAVK